LYLGSDASNLCRKLVGVASTKWCSAKNCTVRYHLSGNHYDPLEDLYLTATKTDIKYYTPMVPRKYLITEHLEDILLESEVTLQTANKWEEEFALFGPGKGSYKISQDLFDGTNDQETKEVNFKSPMKSKPHKFTDSELSFLKNMNSVKQQFLTLRQLKQGSLGRV